MQVFCTRCGHQFQVARQGQVYCPSCGVLLGPAPVNAAEPEAEQAPQSPDSASGVPGIAPLAPGYGAPNRETGAAGYPPVGYPLSAPAPLPMPAPGTVPLPPSAYPGAFGAASPPYGYSPALAAASAVAAQADRRLRRRAWVLRGSLIVLALLLVLGAGVGLVTIERQQQQVAQASSTPTPAIQVPDGFVEFSDPGGVFACGVPSAWEQISSASASLTVAEFGDPAHQTTLTIQYTQNSSLDEVGSDDQALQSLAGSYSGGKVAAKSQQPNSTFAGEMWAEEDATLTYAGASGPVTLHVAALSAIHNATVGNVSVRYVVTMIEIAPAASFSKTDANEFQAVQTSFVFLA